MRLFMSSLLSLSKIWIAYIWNIMERKMSQGTEKEISEKYSTIKGLNSFSDEIL